MKIVEQVKEFFFDNPSLITIVGHRKQSERLEDLYYRITGESIGCGGCADKTLMGYNSLLVFLEQIKIPGHSIFKNKVMMKYKLKRGVVVYSSTHLRHFNDQSMTDEIAVDILKENKLNAQLFESMPSESPTDDELAMDGENLTTGELVMEMPKKQNFNKGKK